MNHSVSGSGKRKGGGQGDREGGGGGGGGGGGEVSSPFAPGTGCCTNMSHLNLTPIGH